MTLTQDRRRAMVLEEIEFLVGTDSPERIAQRLGYDNLRHLRQLLRRWGRSDLAEKFQREDLA